MKIIRLVTEGDCEGRSTKTIGYFTGSLNQIITFCISQNIKPYYFFKAEEIEITDVSNIIPITQVDRGAYGRLRYTTPDELFKQQKIKEASDKLTDEEKQLLNLN